MKRDPRTAKNIRGSRVAALAALALIACLLTLTGPAAAEELPVWPEVGSARFVPYQLSGPAAERLNLIILADGYQAHEMDKFREDLDRNLAVLWTVEPFRSYRYYLNVYALEIVSQDSGIRCDPGEDSPADVKSAKNTALRLWYSDGCENPVARGVTYGPAPLGSPPGTRNGAQQRTWYLENWVAPGLGIPIDSQNIQTLAIANTFTYGGIGGFHATTTGGAPQGPLVSIHELGHSLGRIWDCYPYSARNVWRGCWTGGEPDSITHTLYTSTDKMIEDEHKWWRWIGEDSGSSGSPIGLYEGGYSWPCGVRRASEYSMMRWTGYYFDVVQREHMTIRITGMRDADRMALRHTPEGQVGPKDVVWVETMHPRYHELDVTWSVNGKVLETHNSRHLELAKLGVREGDRIHLTVKDPTEFVRDPKWTEGPRLTQTREWTVGQPLPRRETEVAFTLSTPTDRPVGGREVVFVETTHPTGRVLDVAWLLDGKAVPNPHNGRNLDLGKLGLPEGTFELKAVVTDPAAPSGGSETRAWVVDNVLPSAPRTLSEPLATLPGEVEHNVYFNEFEMLLEPRDDLTGYDRPIYVAGEFQLNGGGWYNYYGFPDEPFGTPFKFTHSGTDIKDLTYGNLGTGGHAKVPWEQRYLDHELFGTFWPGFGTHAIEHRAIDPAGNIGRPDMFKATVLPGKSPASDKVVTGRHKGTLVVDRGVTRIDGAAIGGGVVVKPGASLVVTKGSKIDGGLKADGAAVIHVFGAVVHGDSSITGSADDVIVAGATFNGSLTVSGNRAAVVEFLSGKRHQYGVALVGNTVTGDLVCRDNVPGVTDFGAPNSVKGARRGQAEDL